MIQQSEIKQILRPSLHVIPALVGAAIGLVLISLFLLAAGHPDPTWPKLWRLQPLTIVPLAGAAGGVFVSVMGVFRSRQGLVKLIAYLVSVLGFIVALWLGSVLGLNGYYWH